MKLHTITLITATVTLALAQHAKAIVIPTTTEFSKLTVALTVETNKPEVETGNAVIDSTGKAKITNKTILDLFATASGADPNEWRTNGAQLIFDWDTYQAAIADKTGTNILLYIGSGDAVSNGTVTAYFDVDWFYNFADNLGSPRWAYGALKDKRIALATGTDNETATSQGFFELSYSDSDDTSSDLTIFGDGPNTEHYVQHYSDGSPTFWTDTENFKPFCASQKEIVNGQSPATVNGTIKANGKGSGNNTFIYPIE